MRSEQAAVVIREGGEEGGGGMDGEVGGAHALHGESNSV
jgi:hypothetical protein